MMRKLIMRFSHNSNEKLYELWSRFQGLLRKCPHHGPFQLAICPLFLKGNGLPK